MCAFYAKRINIFWEEWNFNPKILWKELNISKSKDHSNGQNIFSKQAQLAEKRVAEKLKILYSLRRQCCTCKYIFKRLNLVSRPLKWSRCCITERMGKKSVQANKKHLHSSNKNCWYNLSTPHSHFARKDFGPCQSMLIEQTVQGKPP